MADASTTTLEALARVTDAALANLSREDLLTELLSRITEVVQADTAAILVVDEERHQLVARAAKGIEEEVRQGVRLPIGAGFAGRVAAERRPVIIPDVDHAHILNPLLRERGIRSLLGVPLVVEGRVIGVLHVGTLVRRDFDDDDVRLMQLVADRAAMTVAHTRSVEERWLAEGLQRALLPVQMPELAFARVAARYRPAEKATRLGGDWYDVIELPDGRIGIVVGDVVGRGVTAAAVMAQARTALRAYALEGHGPVDVAERLNHLMLQVESRRSATMVYLAYDQETGSVEAVSAGHPPPVVRRPQGTTELVELPASPPLGVSNAAMYERGEFELGEGSALVLYTDGLVERRGESLDTGLERLRAAVVQGPADPDLLCAYLVGHVEHDDEDDVAVLALALQPVPDHLTLRLTAETRSLARLRRQISRWSVHHGADHHVAYDITLAASEAAANAVEHAYAPGGGTFDVEARADDGALVVEVHDQGSWREERRSDRGRGIMLMRALVDEVDLQPSSGGGTTVLLRKRLP